MSRAWPIAVLLAGCAPEARDLSLADAGGGPVSWLDHGDHDPPEIPLGRSCRPLDDPDGVVEWCARLSPEEVEEPGVLPPTDGLPPDEPAQSATVRCGTFNLIGGVQLAGPPETPLVTYCDYELAGGARTVRIGEHRALERRMLEEGTCVPVAQGFAAAPVDESRVRVALATADGARIWDLAPDGAPLGEPAQVPGGPALGVGLWSGADGERLLLGALDTSLAVVPLADGAPTGAPAPTLGEVVAWGAAEVDGDRVLAACLPDGRLRVTREGARPMLAFLEAGTCAGREALGVAGIGERLAITWTDGAAGRLAVLRGSVPIAEWDLDGRRPAVARDGDRGFVTLDASGAVTRWDLDGEPVAHGRHPLLEPIGPNLFDLKITVDGEHLLVASTAEDFVSNERHYFLYHVLEVARSVLP